MRIKISVQIFIINIFISGCASFQHPTNSDFILGQWSYPGPFGVVEIKKEFDVFQLIQVSNDNRSKAPGELMGEFTYIEESGEYVGRHIWGGTKSQSTQWGKEGGLYIKRISKNRINIFYLDSKYPGGWVFSRVKSPVEEGNNVVVPDVVVKGCATLRIKDHQQILKEVDRMDPEQIARWHCYRQNMEERMRKIRLLEMLDSFALGRLQKRNKINYFSTELVRNDS